MVNGRTRERLEKAQAGQSLIEMAIGMVLLTMIMSAVIDLGRIWFSYLALEDAAGEAALFLTIFPYCAESTDIDPHHTSDPTFCADPDNAKFRAQHAMGNDFIGFNWNQVTFEPDLDTCPNYYLEFADCVSTIRYASEPFTVRMKYTFYLISPFIPNMGPGQNRIELTATAAQQVIRSNTSY